MIYAAMADSSTGGRGDGGQWGRAGRGCGSSAAGEGMGCMLAEAVCATNPHHHACLIIPVQARNVMVDEGHRIKLGDFGLAHAYDEGKPFWVMFKAMQLSIRWLCYEIMGPPPKCASEKSERCGALGCVRRVAPCLCASVSLFFPAPFCRRTPCSVPFLSLLRPSTITDTVPLLTWTVHL